jgi:acetate kinase
MIKRNKEPNRWQQNSSGVLVINAGSATVKFRLYSENNTVLDGIIDGIGNKSKISVHVQGTVLEGHTRIRSYDEAAHFILDFIDKSFKQTMIRKIAYRVVHGGELKDHAVITPHVLKYLYSVAHLAPLHMPPALSIIKECMKRLKNVKHIACFDTAFHRTIPSVAKYYAIPWKLTKKYGIQRYGFHGLAHEYMLKTTEKRFGKLSRVITCQLGNGDSITAIKNGKSIDTSMGFTPLEGLEMGTRSGNIDPALVAFLADKERKSAGEIVKILENQSGLKGIAGDNDVRHLLKRKDAKAKLALDIFVYDVRKYIGAYAAVLGGVDCIVLGGGIAQSDVLRKRILSGFKAKSLVVETDEQEIMFYISKRF